MSPYEYFLAGYWDSARLPDKPTGVWPVPVISYSRELDRWRLELFSDLSFWSNTNNIFGASRGSEEATHHNICLQNWSDSSSGRESLLGRTFCVPVLVWKQSSLAERGMTLCGKHSLGQNSPLVCQLTVSLGLLWAQTKIEGKYFNYNCQKHLTTTITVMWVSHIGLQFTAWLSNCPATCWVVISRNSCH